MGLEPHRLRWLRAPGFEDPDQTERAKILHVAVLATVSAVMVAMVVGWEQVLPETIPVVLFYLFLNAVALRAIHRGHIRVVGTIYCTLTWGGVAYGHLVLGHPDAALVASFLNIVLLAGFCVGAMAALGFGLAGVAWVGATGWLEAVGRLPAPAVPIRPIDVVLQTVMTTAVTAVLAGYGFRRMRLAIEASRASVIRNRALAELGQRVVECRDLGEFGEHVAREVKRITGAPEVGVYAPRGDGPELLASVGTAPTADLSRIPGEERHISTSTEGAVFRVWASQGGRVNAVITLGGLHGVSGHDGVFLGGCVALVEAAVQRMDAERQLRHAQRMETVGQLTGGVAHDFNNLLTSIIGGSQMVADEVEDPEHRAMLMDVVRAGDHASVLTRRLLSFSRRATLEYTTLDLRELVRSLGRLLERMVGERVSLKLPDPGPPVWIYGDRSSVEQIVLNLVLNGRDALEGQDGTVELEVRVEGSGPEAHALLRVRDDGCGMEPSTLDRVFEPFFTTKPAGKGTGLGLSTVRSAVETLGGQIELSSEPGKGTVFEIRAPLVDAPSADRAVPQAPSPAEGEPRRLVLLVEDHDLVRRTLARTLEHAGFRIEEAGDGRAALDRIHEGLAPDVIVSDMVMPRMDGRQLVAALRAEEISVPVVLLSGYAELPAAQSVELQGLPVLSKPPAAGELLRTVLDVLPPG